MKWSGFNTGLALHYRSFSPLEFFCDISNSFSVPFMSVLPQEYRAQLLRTKVQSCASTLLLSNTRLPGLSELGWWYHALTHKGCSIVAGVNLCPGWLELCSVVYAQGRTDKTHTRAPCHGGRSREMNTVNPAYQLDFIFIKLKYLLHAELRRCEDEQYIMLYEKAHDKPRLEPWKHVPRFRHRFVFPSSREKWQLNLFPFSVPQNCLPLRNV